MRTITFILKLAALCGIVALTYRFFMPDDPRAAYTASGVMFSISAISLNRRMAFTGEEKYPGVLGIFSFMFFIGPLALFRVLPYELYRSGFTKNVYEFRLDDVVVYLMAGFVMAVWIWVPFACYEIIDLLTGRRSATQSV